MSPFIWMVSLLLLIAPMAWAHGENKPGPEGGYIRMPGAYHIELLPQAKGYKVRLLDMQFLHPTVERSRIKVVWSQNGQSSPLNCRPQGRVFQCDWPHGKQPTQGYLKVSSQRLGLQGINVTYPLPLTHTQPVLKAYHH